MTNRRLDNIHTVCIPTASYGILGTSWAKWVQVSPSPQNFCGTEQIFWRGKNIPVNKSKGKLVAGQKIRKTNSY